MQSGLKFMLMVLLTLASCKTENKREIKTEAITFTKEGELSIFRKDSLLTKLDIEIADTEYETQTGLMYRETMLENQAMLFIFQDLEVHSFYMKNTQIPLDIIYIDDNLKIASFQKNAQPFDEKGLSSQVPVKYVLEVTAGLSDNLGLSLGDQIEFSKN